MNVTYKKLTKELLEKCIDSLNTPSKNNTYVLYTGWLGNLLFDLAMLGMTINIPYYSVYTPKKGKYHYVFSLFSKHGAVKAYVNKNHMFEIKNGSELLFTTNNLDKFTFKKLKSYENC